MNEDLFVTTWDRGAATLKVRLRRQDDEEDEYDEDAEEEREFVARVVKALLAYEPPAEKKQSVMNRMIPEVVHVPARAILSKREQTRWQKGAESHKEWVSTTQSSSDGMLLKLVRHPHGADLDEHCKRCVARLQEALGLQEEEAER